MIHSAPFVANEDESKVPNYTLPDPLEGRDGKPVKNSKEWEKTRRPEILAIFEAEMFGKTPSDTHLKVRSSVKSREPVFGGLGIRELVEIEVRHGTARKVIELLVYLPTEKRHAPVFLGLNFSGNHTVQNDPGIPIPKSWVPESKAGDVLDHQATEKGRGKESSRWPVESILKKGFGVATIYYGDIEPDHKEGFKTGIRSFFPAVAPEDWSAIGVWSWGLSRAVDYLEKNPKVDARNILVIGHSRLGKAALWAGALDQRFAMVFSNNSGEGGAAISRRCFGETVERINTSFPHWFSGKFKQYNLKEQSMPMDQHMLIALMAPRPVYIASASEDLWADPKGEFLSGKHAGPVYALFGKEGVEVSEMPTINAPVGKTIGYHLRQGKHDITPYDWDQYMDFAQRHGAIQTGAPRPNQ